MQHMSPNGIDFNIFYSLFLQIQIEGPFNLTKDLDQGKCIRIKLISDNKMGNTFCWNYFSPRVSENEICKHIITK